MKMMQTDLQNTKTEKPDLEIWLLIPICIRAFMFSERLVHWVKQLSCSSFQLQVNISFISHLDSRNLNLKIIVLTAKSNKFTAFTSMKICEGVRTHAFLKAIEKYIGFGQNITIYQ